VELKVRDMSCGHCKATIEKALADAGYDDIHVDLAKKTVTVEGTDEEAVRAVIEAKGYHVE